MQYVFYVELEDNWSKYFGKQCENIAMVQTHKTECKNSLNVLSKCAPLLKTCKVTDEIYQRYINRVELGQISDNLSPNENKKIGR